VKQQHRTAIGALLMAAAMPWASWAGEGGTSHILPGANATLVDVLPTASGSFVKPMYLNYSGSARAQIPTAAGVVSNADATANTFVFGGGYTFDSTVLGGAHYTVAAFLPYSFLDISAYAQGSQGATLVRKKSSVDGFGDLTVVPVMLAWKSGENVQYDFLLPIYAPTGDYEKGRLGNPGLNYWTFDPVFGVTYSNRKSGFNALLHAGYAWNTENNATDYKSGAQLHFDGAIEQILPAAGGFLALGVEAFYFRQVTGDGGQGAKLGEFKGMTAGVGPVLGYIKPIGRNSLALEAKWLPELDTKNRLEGDYIWVRAAYKF
jgi:hypothetical protein